MLWLAIAVGIQSVEGAESVLPMEGWLESVVKLTTGLSLCAGVMLEEPGLVATAYHCVASGRRPKVETQGGEWAIGRTVATDPENDLALVRVDAFEAWQGRAFVEEPPRVGEEVWALGHPFGFNADRVPSLEGLLYFSVSAGIVSGVGPKLVQVDAPLNPGNSGGPILNANGDIVGIASRKLRAEGLSFLAPAHLVDALQEEVGEFRRLGGQYSLLVGALVSADIQSMGSVGLGARVTLRDTLVLTGSAGRPLGANWEALRRGGVSWVAWEVSAALRGRVARGQWSTALDGGVVLVGRDSLEARIEGDRLVAFGGPQAMALGGLVELQFGGMGYGLRLVPAENGEFDRYLVISTGLGGVQGTF